MNGDELIPCLKYWPQTFLCPQPVIKCVANKDWWLGKGEEKRDFHLIVTQHIQIPCHAGKNDKIWQSWISHCSLSHPPKHPHNTASASTQYYGNILKTFPEYFTHFPTFNEIRVIKITTLTGISKINNEAFGGFLGVEWIEYWIKEI